MVIVTRCSNHCHFLHAGFFMSLGDAMDDLEVALRNLHGGQADEQEWGAMGFGESVVVPTCQTQENHLHIPATFSRYLRDNIKKPEGSFRIVIWRCCCISKFSETATFFFFQLSHCRTSFWSSVTSPTPRSVEVA